VECVAPRAERAILRRSRFRFDDGSDQYIYNLGIKGLPKGTYRLQILGDSDSQEEYFRIV